jgi:outer membrane protein assembly factor BamB
VVRKPVVVGIVFLFILSSTIPMVVGFDTPDVDDNGLMDSAWPMKCHDTRHTGRSPYSTVDNHGVEKWRYRMDYGMESGIVIGDDGVLYFGAQDSYLHAVNPDGSLKWKYKTDDWIWSTPAIAEDGTLYVGTYSNTLYAIYHNGTFRWKIDCDGSISSSPVISFDGTIYVGTMGPETKGRIYALYPNGTVKWHYDTGYWIVSDPAIGDDGTVYIGSGDSYLYAMNPNGTLKWRFKTEDRIKSHPSIADDGIIYFDSYDGKLYALNPNGTLKWTHSGGCACASASIDEDGIIYIGGYHLTAIYPNGTRKWRFTFGTKLNSHHSSPAISSEGTIYIGVSKEGSAGGYIYSFNNDGTEQWYKKIANVGVTSSPSIGENGIVYIGSSSRDIGGDSYGYLYAFGRNETNQPPNQPEIDGPSIGFRNTQQSYNFSVSDPDLDNIELYVDWGDDTNSGWIGPYKSGENIVLNHTWSERGTYTIQTKARDTYDGSESDWGILMVTMPKNKAVGSPFIRYLVNNPILRQSIIDDDCDCKDNSDWFFPIVCTLLYTYGTSLVKIQEFLAQTESPLLKLLSVILLNYIWHSNLDELWEIFNCDWIYNIPNNNTM